MMHLPVEVALTPPAVVTGCIYAMRKRNCTYAGRAGEDSVARGYEEKSWPKTSAIFWSIGLSVGAVHRIYGYPAMASTGLWGRLNAPKMIRDLYRSDTRRWLRSWPARTKIYRRGWGLASRPAGPARFICLMTFNDARMDHSPVLAMWGSRRSALEVFYQRKSIWSRSQRWASDYVLQLSDAEQRAARGGLCDADRHGQKDGDLPDFSA